MAYRKPRKTDQLREAAGHVTYELMMLVHSADVVGAHYGSPAVFSDEQSNMALESFLLHFRNLRDFLCPSQTPKEDDIIATDFLDKQVRDIGDRTKLSQDKQRLNGMLTHLTYRRNEYIAEGAHTWKVGGMRAAMLEEMGRFMLLLPAERTEWFPGISLVPQPSRGARFEPEPDTTRQPST